MALEDVDSEARSEESGSCVPQMVTSGVRKAFNVAKPVPTSGVLWRLIRRAWETMRVMLSGLRSGRGVSRGSGAGGRGGGAGALVGKQPVALEPVELEPRAEPGGGMSGDAVAR